MSTKVDDAAEYEEDLALIEKLERRPSDLQLRGGMPRESAIVVVITGLVAMFAAMGLILAEITALKNPGLPLSCDINPIIGCGASLNSWQNTLIGDIPNSVFGFAFFAGMTALGLVWLGGGTCARWLWRLASAGCGLGILWLMWFQYQAFFVEKALCPYCLVTWTFSIPLFTHVLVRAVQAGHLWVTRPRAFLVRNRWLIVGAVYLILIVMIAAVFWNQWLALLS